jgi:hypothetical protein
MKSEGVVGPELGKAWAISTTALLAILTLVFAAGAPKAQAQSYQVLYNFGSNGGVLDGNVPNDGFIFDPAGNIYGTTAYGGTNCLAYGEDGCGTVFELSPSSGGWTETVLYSFCTTGYPNSCPDGAHPYDGLVRDSAGNLYGTTQMGGIDGGWGTVFELSPPTIAGGAWTETVLYAFGGNTTHDGCYPLAKVTFDGTGNLYGTASQCGTYGYGAVYELSQSAGGWVETNLHMFGGNLVTPHDGGTPKAGVEFSPYNNSGILYGTTESFGFGGGTVFELTPSSGAQWSETILQNFLRYPSPGSPISIVSFDPQGNLYGTFSEGGSGICGQYEGCGGVFELALQAGGGYSTRVYDFDGVDGYAPTGGLAMDFAHHAAYGITEGGGQYIDACQGTGCGTAFSMNSRGSETVLYDFCSLANCADGNFQGRTFPVYPSGSLFLRSGELFGAAPYGGAYNQGVVFELAVPIE